MSDSTCRYEVAVVEAARAGNLSHGLRAHARRCALCADSVRVTEWIGDVALQLGRNQPAPDPTYIWLRAELARRAEAEGTSTWRRIGVAAAQGLALGGLSAAAMLAALPKVAGAVMAVRTELSTALAQTPVVDMTVIGTVWLGFPLLLAATYLLVLRPLR